MAEKFMEMDLQKLGQCMRMARETVNKIRKEHGEHEVTQGHIAKLLQVRAPTVSDWEQGKKHPGFLNVLRYCEVLDMTPDELVGIKTNRRIAVESTEEERDMILVLAHECEQETEFNRLQTKLRNLVQHLKTFFSRAQRQ